MTPPDTSTTAVEAMIARLRDPYIGKCCDHADEAADMITKLLSALGEATERAERADSARGSMTLEIAQLNNIIEASEKRMTDMIERAMHAERQVNNGVAERDTMVIAHNTALRTARQEREDAWKFRDRTLDHWIKTANERDDLRAEIERLTMERDEAMSDAREIAETNLHAAAAYEGAQDAAKMLRAATNDATDAARNAAWDAALDAQLTHFIEIAEAGE